MKSATPKKKRKLNVRLLRRIQKHILEEPRRFFMEDFVAEFNKEYPEGWKLLAKYNKDLSKIPPPCGTAHCIAGATNLLTGGTWPGNVDRAEKKLGLPPLWDDLACDQKHPLFQLKGWPIKFRRPYNKAKTPKQRAKIACARIDHLIATGE